MTECNIPSICINDHYNHRWNSTLQLSEMEEETIVKILMYFTISDIYS